MTWFATGAAVFTSAYGADEASEARDERKRALAGQTAAERDRERRINASIGVVNRLYDSEDRQQQVADYAQALRGVLGDRLEKQRGRAGRRRKFAVAKSGLTGGSVDRDTQRTLGEEFEEGALANERRVASSANDLRSQDEQNRLQLISMVRSGLDAGTALQRGVSRQQATLDGSMAANTGAALGDVFKNTSDTYRRIQEREARRRGFGYDATRSDIYGGRSTG